MAVLAPEVRSAAPRWLIRHETLLAAILVVALAILGLFNERFLTIDNLLNQGRLMTEVGLLALPMTLIIITGGIDLSVGSVVALAGVTGAMAAARFESAPALAALIAALVVGLVTGIMNGSLIAYLGVPAFVATLAMLTVARGLAFIVSDGRSVGNLPPSGCLDSKHTVIRLPPVLSPAW